EIEETVRRIDKIETALEPDFQQHFVNAMAVPNKVEPFPKLAEAVKLPERKVLEPAGGDGGGRRRRRSRS
ncbi:MAG: drug:proton antiporter, partial [Nitratireductor sp.]|nr:drug:proton antiporter [Nitratireductor sp.]